MKPNTPGFVGANLRLARKLRGKTAVALSEGLGLTKQAISNYETGKQSPSPEIAERICEVLDFPMSFFMRKRKHHQRKSGPSFYRSMTAATKIARERAEAYFDVLLDLSDIIEAFLELPTVNFPELHPPSDPTQISDRFIEDAAVEVRKFWGLADGPISNTIWLLENNGAIVIRRPLGAETLDAFSRWVDGRPYIILGSEKNSAARSRFDVGHELGHLVLHKNIPEVCLRNANYFSLIEDQAHRFSGAFQFPETSFVREVSNCSLYTFQLLKRRWKLSIGMMIKRCENLELVGDKKITSLWKSYSRNGWRTFEPLDDELEVEQPYLLNESVQLMIEENLLSRSNILAELGLYHRDVESCAGLSLNVLNPKIDEVTTLQSRRSPVKRESVGDSQAKIFEFPSSEKLRN